MQTRMGIVQKRRSELRGRSRLEPKERLRKCCVRTVTQNISETPLRRGRDRISGGGGSGGGKKECCGALASRPRPSSGKLETWYWFHWKTRDHVHTKLNGHDVKITKWEEQQRNVLLYQRMNSFLFDCNRNLEKEGWVQEYSSMLGLVKHSLYYCR